MKKYLIGYVSVLALCISKAQPFVGLSQFMFNRPLYNPGASGTGENQFNAHAISRLQWVGVEGAPTTHAAWVDYRFNAYRFAISGVVIQEKAGGYDQMDFTLNYAYHLKINRNWNLGMGIRGGVLNARFGGNSIERYWDMNDNVVLAAHYNLLLPKFGMGFHLFNKFAYVSITSPDMVVIDADNILFDKKQGVAAQPRSYIVLTGTRLRLNDLYAFYPNLYAYYHPLFGYRVDANAIFEITDYFWIGGTYSTTGNQAVLAGTNLSTRMRFGYTFIFNYGSMASIPLVSHEFNLMIRADRLFKASPK